jgi:hypothetical protein
MALLAVVKDVCAAVGVALPQSIFSGITGNRTMAEMLSCANEMAQRIAYDYRDWTRLRTTVTYTGDGTATAFNLPANYKRMLLTSNVWRSTSSVSPMAFIPDTDEWLNRRARQYSNANGEWTILGGQIRIAPALAVGQSAYFAYLDKNCVALSSGGTSDSFLNDADGFTLDERLLKLGMIVDWKQKKGGSYAEDMGTFGDAMAMAMGSDSPAPIIVGRTVTSLDARVAIPTQTIYVPGMVP